MIKNMQIKTIEEWPDEIQEKIIDKHRFALVEYFEWWDFDGLLDLTSKELKARNMKKQINIPYKIIAFDIERGDYLHIEPTYNRTDWENDFRKYLRIPKDLWKNLSYNFENISSNWGGSYNTKIVFEPYFESDRNFTNRETTILDNAKELWDDKVHEALSMLKGEYNGLISNEAVKEHMIENEWYFDEDGNIQG